MIWRDSRGRAEARQAAPSAKIGLNIFTDEGRVRGLFLLRIARGELGSG